jgi:hypothetical protein
VYNVKTVFNHLIALRFGEDMVKEYEISDSIVHECQIHLLFLPKIKPFSEWEVLTFSSILANMYGLFFQSVQTTHVYNYLTSYRDYKNPMYVERSRAFHNIMI